MSLTAIFLSIITFFTGLHSLISPFVALILSPTPTLFPSPTPIISTITPLISRVSVPKPTAIGDTAPWGVSQQVDEHTWTLKINMDSDIAAPKEILSALNDYRIRHGSQPLTQNDNLTTFAQNRAAYIASIKNTDGHKGFIDYLEKQDGYNKLGFTWVGENVSYGYRLEAVHLIEWVYAGDKPHDDNQLDNKWNYVGIGVKDTATCLIFATGKR
jgi:uncharacterized protein YkwD